MLRFAVIALVIGCQGSSSPSPNPNPYPNPNPNPNPIGSGSADIVDDEGSARVKPEEPDPVDVGKAIAELGAIPAWQAVVDRAQYLERRGQHGVVFGTIAPAG